MATLKYVLFLLLMIWCSYSFGADGYFVKYQVNVEKPVSDVKALSFGKQSELSIFETKTEGGFWVDHRPGAKSSLYGMYGIGIEPTSGSVYVNFFQSAGLISSPDQYLGGRFQFMEEIGLGIRDKEKQTSVGLLYKHISSAGLERPNKGRDLFGIQVMIPFP